MRQQQTATLKPYRHGYHFEVLKRFRLGPVRYSQWFANVAEADNAFRNGDLKLSTTPWFYGEH